jgi:hypothetical protein
MVGRPPQVVDPRQLIGASIQDDVLDEQRKQLSLRTPVSAVFTVGYIRTGPERAATPAHYCDQDFRVEAKGLEPSNLLTASL